MRHLLFALMLTMLAGCDSAALIANIDTYTCAWLPSVAVDCGEPAVHDRAINVLEHGLTFAHIECSGTFNSQGYGSYRASKLQDGSCLASGTYLVPYAYGVPFSRAGSQYSPRGEAGADTCPVEIPDWFVLSAEGGEWKAGSSPKDIETFCTGFNLEAFGVDP